MGRAAAHGIMFTFQVSEGHVQLNRHWAHSLLRKAISIMSKQIVAKFRELEEIFSS